MTDKTVPFENYSTIILLTEVKQITGLQEQKAILN